MTDRTSSLLGRTSSIGFRQEYDWNKSQKNLRSSVARKIYDTKFDEKSYTVLNRQEALKLKGDGSWAAGKVILTDQILVFVIEPEDSLVDWVPLHEVAEVRPRYTRELTRTQSTGPKSHASSDLNLLAAVANLDSPIGRRISANNNSNRPSRNRTDRDTTDLEVHTVSEGYNSGRVYALRFPRQEIMQEWFVSIEEQSRLASISFRKLSQLRRMQETARTIYTSNFFQIIITLLITFNFGVNAAGAQMEPTRSTEGEGIFRTFDIVLTVLFAMELALNAFGHWFVPFASNPWSLFDALVVTLSIIGLLIESMVGASVIRLLRVFRILRVVGRFRALQRVATAILVSVIPVLNAFLIAMLIVLIYAVLGVYFFAERSQDHFGTFSRSLYTLFILAALNQWIAEEELPTFDPVTTKIDWSVVFFLFTYVVIVLWTLIQVFVAVLLDSFNNATAQENIEKAIENQKKARTVSSAFDPLSQELFAAFDTEADLTKRIREVFQMLDSDREGQIDFLHMREGLRKLDLEPNMHLTKEDFEIATHSLSICDREGRIDFAAFEQIVREQLLHFMQRRISDACMISHSGPEGLAMLSTMKYLLLAQDGGRMEEMSTRVETMEEEIRGLKRSVSREFSELKAILGARQTIPARPVTGEANGENGQAGGGQSHLADGDKRLSTAEEHGGGSRMEIEDLDVSSAEVETSLAPKTVLSSVSDYEMSSQLASSAFRELPTLKEEPTEPESVTTTIFTARSSSSNDGTPAPGAFVC